MSRVESQFNRRAEALPHRATLSADDSFLIRLALRRVYVNEMKTITSDEKACSLLKMWKTSGRESFSIIVKRVVSTPGTLGALLSCVEEV